MSEAVALGDAPRRSLVPALGRHGVLVALLLLILFGWLRYDNFLSAFNILTVLRYNAMFALVALGMCFVIMTGGNLQVFRNPGFQFIGLGRVLEIPFQAILMAAIVAAAAWTFLRTVFGSQILAVGGNEMAALFVG